MIKVCCTSVFKLLRLIFNHCIDNGIYGYIYHWKKANIVLIHQKGDKQTLKNFRSESLLPICCKIFERLLYNEMFYFILKPEDSCINHLFSETYNIYKSFDDDYEARGVSLTFQKLSINSTTTCIQITRKWDIG